MSSEFEGPGTLTCSGAPVEWLVPGRCSRGEEHPVRERHQCGEAVLLKHPSLSARYHSCTAARKLAFRESSEPTDSRTKPREH